MGALGIIGKCSWSSRSLPNVSRCWRFVVAIRHVEPGHHHEWVWLLRRFEQVSGRSVQPYVDALYGYADRYGFDEAGMIVDQLLVDGTARAGVRRVWPVTEAIKANLVEARWPGASRENGHTGCGAARALSDGRSARRLA